MANEQRTAHQPLHPSVISRLHPSYIRLHNTELQYGEPLHISWNPASRETSGDLAASPLLDVAKTEDFYLTHARIRTFTPHGAVPEGGWPVFIFIHGGGWTLGNINTEASYATRQAVGAHCVVISVDYRLAPEHKYPAAVEDVVEALDWVLQNGADTLGINTSRIAVGGFSSGGNLAAILTLKAAERIPPVPLVMQVLVAPVIDNTSSVDTLWGVNKHAPLLSPENMLWFRNNYLPNKDDWSKWDASPLFAPKELLAKAPRAWIGVSDVDILREEGLLYGKILREQGVEVKTVVYEGAPHTAALMDGELVALYGHHTKRHPSLRLFVGVVEVGAQIVIDAVDALAKAFSQN